MKCMRIRIPYNIMSRRQLPKRSTRGQPPVRSQEQQKADNQLYARLFGIDSLQEPQQPPPTPEEILRQQEKQRHRQMLQKNFRGYTFGRAHHYFFDLEQFPRLEGHPSYAIDEQNVFNFTFSQQGKLIKGEPLSEILNRKYFGLPATHQRHEEEQKTKNLCHMHLFSNEDRKYSMQRSLLTCKKLLQHLPKLATNNKISEFQAFIVKESGLQILANQNQSLQAKAALLKSKLQQLEAKKESNKTSSEYLDQLLFYSSLDQRLHDKVKELNKKINISLIANTLVNTEWVYQRYIQQTPQSLENILAAILNYHLHEHKAIRPETLKILTTQYKVPLTKMKNKEALIILPCRLYSLGSPRLRQIANNIINQAVIKESEQMGFYSLKMAWAKLFQVDLSIQKPAVIKYEEYKTRMDFFIQKAKELKTQREGKQLQNIQKNEYYLDEFINFQEFTPQLNQKVTLFKRRQAVLINDKELMLLSLYAYICRGLQQLQPLFDSDPTACDLFVSDFYSKHSLSLTEATGSEFIGVLDNCLEYFCECVTRPPPFTEFNYQIELQFDSEKGVALVWKGEKQEDEWVSESQSERRHDSEEEIAPGSIPKKKIKEA